MKNQLIFLILMSFLRNCYELFFIPLFALTASIFVLLIAYIANNLYHSLELNKNLPKINNDHCFNFDIENFSPEDIEYFNKDYMISSAGNIIDKWHLAKPTSEVKSGNIFLISRKMNLPAHNKAEINNNQELLVSLTINNYPSELKLLSHGLYVRNNDVYIINHAYSYGGERVDRFEIDVVKKTATYKDSSVLPAELYGTGNDLIVLDNDTFIITSFYVFKHDKDQHGFFKKFLGMLLQGGVRIKLTYVYSCSYSKQECVLLEGTEALMNNGITWDRKEKVYIVDAVGAQLREFKLENFVENDKNNYKNIRLSQGTVWNPGYGMDNVSYNPETHTISASLIGRGIDYLKTVEYIEKHRKVPPVPSKEDLENPDTLIPNAGAGIFDLNTNKCKIKN